MVDRETNRCARWIKEAIWIRKTVSTMNRDRATFTCWTVYAPRHIASSDNSVPDEVEITSCVIINIA